MKWSVSKAKQFQRCQRQWYYKEVVSQHSAPANSIRREVYLLGLLKTISAWRGEIVDDALTKAFLNWHKYGRRLNPGDIIAKARRQFDEQLAIAREHRLYERGLTPSRWKQPAFVAFRAMEYEGAIPQEKLDEAWDDIEQAIRNLFEMREIAKAMQGAKALVAQRSLQFGHSGMTATAKPDLVVFPKEGPPVVIDWKVHAFGVQEAWLQLGIYALALTNATPHKDFPGGGTDWGPTDIRLLEAQLLRKDLREYQLDSTDVARLHRYIATTAYDIQSAVGAAKPKYEDLLPEDFTVTRYPNTCDSCMYKRVCWDGRA